jgi:hypothetical protein
MLVPIFVPIFVPILGPPEVGFFTRRISRAAAGTIGRNGGVSLFPIVRSTGACVSEARVGRSCGAPQLLRHLKNLSQIKHVQGGADPATPVARARADAPGP